MCRETVPSEYAMSITMSSDESLYRQMIAINQLKCKQRREMNFKLIEMSSKNDKENVRFEFANVSLGFR